VFLYSGERFDGSIGLYDLRARYYNHATGRFWARDPEEHRSRCCGRNRNPIIARLQGMNQTQGKKCCGSCLLYSNPYVYADDNAVNLTDPWGKEALSEYGLNVSESEKTAPEEAKLGQTEECDALYTADMEYCE
jgi:hypothetical protein